MAEEIKHTDRAHAVLSASSASRWLNCSPSARMADKFPNTSSVHAEYGTLAHEISEAFIRHELDIICKRTFNRALAKLKSNKLYDTEMDQPIEDYVNFVLEQCSEARKITKDALLLVEETVSVDRYIPDGFGTCDFIAVTNGVLYVTDLKFGKGVRVSAEDNDQLKVYGLGALDAYDMLFDIDTVRLTIVQPRLDAISTWDIPADTLRLWGEDYVTAKAKEAFAGEGKLAMGEWCRFCPAKAVCPEQRAQALELAESEFSEPSIESEEDLLLEVYAIADNVRSYLDAVVEHITAAALKGKKWKGLKLVQGNGRRSIQDQEKAFSILEKDGVDEVLYLNRVTKLQGLGELQKHLGKKRMNDLLGKLIVMSEGKITLVDEKDKRPEIARADDFL